MLSFCSSITGMSVALPLLSVLITSNWRLTRVCASGCLERLTTATIAAGASARAAALLIWLQASAARPVSSAAPLISAGVHGRLPAAACSIRIATSPP